uniref:Uncharacterized protein n=1 Tax=Populus trichocarpa TaxID=3694 RepID=A0A2K2BPX5_POPTR
MPSKSSLQRCMNILFTSKCLSQLINLQILQSKPYSNLKNSGITAIKRNRDLSASRSKASFLSLYALRQIIANLWPSIAVLS